ncbi:MATE family efflux transporter [Anaerocolumna sp. MB42-C2]|uniref:MATE family efflux transporter n=1 Tax=Anaerocolumna sp. MB42-C2 TaxID=3070997 RepID=UPI0027E1CB8F|nr:MATE family efflux transporter [Anaerocolumna sp. MB42-C2]WMJ86971.1 MATE family efflux transporter [Anaerocolumna sp. MB42-C2]
MTKEKKGKIQMDEKRIQLLSKSPVSKAIFTMSIPMVMGMMIQLLYNLIDIYFIGKLEDQNQLAAANITTPLFMILMALSGIIGTGASSYISRCMGKSDYNKASKVLSSGITICISLGILCSIIGSIFISPIVHALGAVDETYSFALDYSLVLLLGAAIIMGNFALGQLLRSEGSALVSMMGMLIGTIANTILDPIFIFTLHMGIQGAAVATVLGNAFGLIYYIIFYVRDKSMIKFKFKNISFEKDIWREIFSIGIPSSTSQLLMGVAVMLCNNLAVSYGNNTVAGIGVASKIMTIGTYIFMGFAAGCQPLLGYNFGAKNYNRVQEIIKKGMLITSVIGTVLTILFGLFSNQIISFFTPLPDVISQGSFILLGLMWSLPVYGAQMVGAVTVQAMGKGKASFLLSIARQGLFYIPILFVFNSAFGLSGLIFAQPLADLLALLLTLVVLTTIMKKSRSLSFEMK